MSKEQHKTYTPKPTWFFVRKSDNKLVFEESKSQAWERHKDAEFKNFGLSDGTTYKKMVNKNKSEIKKLSKQASKARERVDRMYETKEKLITEEFLDEDDPKVKRAEEKIEEQENKIEVLLKKLQEKQGSIVKRAQKAEAAKAKENGYTPPPNQDVKTPNQSGRKRNKILKQLV